MHNAMFNIRPQLRNYFFRFLISVETYFPPFLKEKADHNKKGEQMQVDAILKKLDTATVNRLTTAPFFLSPNLHIIKLKIGPKSIPIQPKLSMSSSKALFVTTQPHIRGGAPNIADITYLGYGKGFSYHKLRRT